VSPTSLDYQGSDVVDTLEALQGKPVYADVGINDTRFGSSNTASTWLGL